MADPEGSTKFCCTLLVGSYNYAAMTDQGWREEGCYALMVFLFGQLMRRNKVEQLKSLK